MHAHEHQQLATEVACYLVPRGLLYTSTFHLIQQQHPLERHMMYVYVLHDVSNHSAKSNNG